VRKVLPVLILCACDGPAPPRTPPRGGELRTFLHDNPRSLDPATADDIVSAELAGQLFEGLTRHAPYDPSRGLELVSGIAERWEVAEGGRLYRFTLREGVFFHDDPCFADGRGHAVTADDVAFSVSRFLRRNQGMDLGLVLEFLEGARDHREGRAPSVAGIRVEGPRKIAFRLSRPWGGFLHAMSRQVAWVVAPEAVALYGDGFATHPVGTGPFRLAEWNPSSHILLARHEHYWRRDPDGTSLPYLDRVKVLLLGGNSRLIDFEEGGQDVAVEVPRDPLWTRKGVRRLTVARSNTIVLAFNLSRDTPYARDRRVRQALAHAVSAEPWVAGGVGVRAGSWLPPGFAEFDPGRRSPEFDLKMAAELLAKAGHPGGRGLPPLVFHVPEPEANQGSGHSGLVENWRKLGLHVELVGLPRPLFWERIERGELDFFRWGIIAGPEPAEQVYAPFWSRSGYRGLGYRNPEFDRVYETLLAQADLSRRRTLCARLEAILEEDAPILLLRRDVWVEAVQPWVVNYEPSVNPFGLRFFEVVRLRKRTP